MKITRSLIVSFGGLFFLLVAFFGVFREVAQAQVQMPPAIELRQVSQFDGFLVTSLENLNDVPLEARVRTLEGGIYTNTLKWVGIPGDATISAYIQLAGNDVEIHVSTSLTLITGLQSQAWEVLPNARGWGRPWTRLVSVSAGQAATVTTGSKMIYTFTVENPSNLTGQNMPLLVTHSRGLNRTSGFPWVANERYIQPAPTGSYTGTITYIPIIRPGEQRSVRLEFVAARVGLYLLDVCVLQIQDTDEGAINCQGYRGFTTGYEDFMPIVMQ